MNKSTLRKIQLFWGYFIGIGALVGFTMMMVDPGGTIFGMKPLLELLIKALPFAAPLFTNFIPSGFVLLIVIGVPNLISIILIHRHNQYDIFSGLLCGLILLLWICLEFYIWSFAIASVVYGIFAILQMVNAIILMNIKK